MNFQITRIPEGFSFSKLVVFGVLVLICLAWFAMSIVLVFHWKRYGMKERFIVVAEGVYFLVSAILIAVSFLFFFYI